MNILIWILVGLIAGALAGWFVKGRGFGIVGDTIVGLLGALLGGLIFSLFGLEADNILGSILVSFIGAVVLLMIVKALRPNTSPAT